MHDTRNARSASPSVGEILVAAAKAAQAIEREFPELREAVVWVRRSLPNVLAREPELDWTALAVWATSAERYGFDAIQRATTAIVDTVAGQVLNDSSASKHPVIADVERLAELLLARMVDILDPSVAREPSTGLDAPLHRWFDRVAEMCVDTVMGTQTRDIKRPQTPRDDASP